jgi:hypothetical protein
MESPIRPPTPSAARTEPPVRPPAESAARTESPSRPPIHATNAWNPTGRNLQPVPGTRLYFAHADALNGPRTFVLLGNQQHLTFVADLDDHRDPASLRSLMIDQFGLYPHLIDLDPEPGLPRVVDLGGRGSPPG